MKNILIVEDDKLLSENIRDLLEGENYSITTAHNLSEAHAQKNSPDLIFLDWRLPDGRGIDFLKAIRSEGSPTPTIMLTSKSDLEDKVLGLELGANDYVTKPFASKELLARIAVQLRSKPQKITTTHALSFKKISLCTDSRKVTYDSHPVSLTKLEFELLKTLLQSPTKVFSRDELLNLVWGFDAFPTTRTVDMHVKQLRQKTCSAYFKTVHGIGYSMS